MERSLGLLALTCLMGLFLSTGCSDPTAAGRFQATPITNIILDDLGVVDEGPEKFAGYRDPEPRDLQSDAEEYAIKSGDVVNISIMDFFQTGVEWMAQKQVSETGRITLPELGPIIAAGRTELELTDAIIGELKPGILKDPTVSIVVVRPTGKVYTVSGAVALTGRYQLTEPDLRIMAALAEAGGIPQAGVDHAYIVRKVQLNSPGSSQEFMPENDRIWEETEVFPPVVAPETNISETGTPGQNTKTPAEDPKEHVPDSPKENTPDPPKEMSPDEAIEELKDIISPLTVIMAPVEMAGQTETPQNISAQDSSAIDLLGEEEPTGQTLPTEGTPGKK
ncbi:MAG: polysaccharide biosynthesis/export family protein, partial [Phycisphaerae bacterium]|nr:polysaccharide biosynthesis/export family protein [Phycisphaerae bacterium]